jgi:hypothetical protein
MKHLRSSMKGSPLYLLIVLLMGSFNVFAAGDPEVSVITDKSLGLSASHGLAKLVKALQDKKISFEKVASLEAARGSTLISTGLAEGEGSAANLLKAGNRTVPKVAEALTVWKTSWQKKPVLVAGGFDDRGVMYALLDIAERIGWSTSKRAVLSEVKEITEQPALADREITIYTMNRNYWESRFYDNAYWARYLDELAKNRYNKIELVFGYENGGFLAPCYPYFFDVEGFSDVKMTALTQEQQQKNLAAMNNLIQMAHDRGIGFSVGIWQHIYRGDNHGFGLPGVVDAQGKPLHSIVTGLTNDNIRPYNKAGLTKFLKLVPNLDGILFHINNESGLKQSELLAFGMDFFKTMKEVSPHLPINVHAKGLTDSLIHGAVGLGLNIRVEQKYWMEQMGLPFHPTHVNRENQFDRRHQYADMLRYPKEYGMFWKLWTGGTSRVLLWGDPGYVRRFAGTTHIYDGVGLGVNEPLATKMGGQPHDTKPFDLLTPAYRYYDYEFERYWHFLQLYGRIGYNPNTPSDVWDKQFEQRFGKKAAPFIQSALGQASWVLPRIVASCYPYINFPTTRGWAERQRLFDLPEYAMAEGSDIQQFASFDEEARLLIEGGETPRMLPSLTSRWFEETSAKINQQIAEAEKASGNTRSKEFISTITDLKILSNLALYHARRIPAAVSYCLFLRTQDVVALDAAIAYERKAVDAWKQIVAAAGDVYTNDMMMGVRDRDLSGHWKDELVPMQKSLDTLASKRKNFQAKGAIKKAPLYRAATVTSYGKQFSISHQPIMSAPVGQPITLKVKVNAPSGLKWIRLRYRSVNQHLDYETLPMEPTSEKDVFQAVVPANKINPRYDFMYFIEVMNNNGQGLIYPQLDKETPYVMVKLVR